MATVEDAIVIPVLRTLNIVGAVDAPAAEDAALVLSLFNRLLNNWNADRRAVYADVFTNYTITPNLQPHTIGASGGTFTVGSRPESIEAINLILTASTPDVNIPLRQRDASWYANLSTPALTSTQPTDFFYNPAYPLGAIYLIPIPTVANGLQIQVRTLLGAMLLSTTFTLPPGYEDAIVLTVSEMATLPYKQQMPPELKRMAREARARIFANNDQPVRIRTQNSGMPSGSLGGGNFNWESRQFTS